MKSACNREVCSALRSGLTSIKARASSRAVVRPVNGVDLNGIAWSQERLQACRVSDLPEEREAGGLRS